jgi:15-cis-phytoene synthase
MQDAFAYCAELVRQADRDRYLASLFAAAEHRGALQALYAFNVEVTRVRDAAREPLPGEIRLQWWTEVLNGERREEAGANPVAAALLATIKRHGLAASTLSALIEARRFDLYDEPMADCAEFEAYARAVSSPLIALPAQVLAGAGAEAAAGPAGIASAAAGLLQAFPAHAAQHRLYVPLQLLARYKVDPQQVFAGQSSQGLNNALADFRKLARRHLAEARELIATVPRQTLPAFLPLALVRPSLDRLERRDAFAPAELSALRRQWLIWRASRNAARIAGLGDFRTRSGRADCAGPKRYGRRWRARHRS